MSLDIARKVLLTESAAIRALASRLDRSFLKAVDMLYRGRGRVIVIGMGKPGFIAQKISASLSSTGTPSMSVHPADAVHGDIGRIHKNDTVIALSKSGETEEIIRILPSIRKIGCRLIAITCNPSSQLGKASDVTLDVSIKTEAEPLTDVPTTSSACMLAMGDALTMALAHKRNFRKKDFARLHPGGALGRRLHLTVNTVMRRGNFNPCVKPHESMKKVLLKITAARAGSATIVDPRGRCLGIFTDGDLRRRFHEITNDMSRPVKEYMTPRPLVVKEDELASDALEMFRRRQVDELPVVDRRGRVVGLLDVQDLLKQGFLL